MEIYELLLIALITLVASCVQGITGFGFGIVAMIFLPTLFHYTEANILSSILSTVTAAVATVTMWNKITWRNLLFPLVGSFVTNYLAVSFVKGAENDLLILLLGVALILLSTYFFFFSNKIRIRPTWYAGLIAGFLSGVLSGLFSIGGPPVVIYYMQSEKDTDRYMATISAYFVLSGMITVAMKTASGFVTVKVLWSLIVGVICMFAGAFIGRLARNRANPNLIKKAVYGVMAVSGLVNIVGAVV